MTSRSRSVLLGLAIASLLAGTGSALWLSNVPRRHASAWFVSGDSPGMNSLHIRGPYDWRAITYGVVVTGPDGKLGIGGTGMSRLPILGETVESTNFYPDTGSFDEIALETHFRLTPKAVSGAAVALPGPDQAELVGTYLLVTEEENWMQRLVDEAPALQR